MATLFLNCEIKRTKSKDGAWCVSVTYPNGYQTTFQNTKEAKEALIIQSKSAKKKWLDKFISKNVENN